MQKLFGIPMGDLLVALAALFAIATAVTVFVAVRNRVALRMALRNVPRRRAQSVLIVLGLMLATALFAASFTTGDTLTHSIRVQVVRDLGNVDILVNSRATEVSGRPAYFDMAYFDTVRNALSGDPNVDGVAPLIRESLPVVAPSTRQSEPSVAVLGVDPQWMAGFDPVVDTDGRPLRVDDLALEEAFVSARLAEVLEISPGDTIEVYAGQVAIPIKVAGVYERGGNPAGPLSIIVPLSTMQSVPGLAGRITDVVISNTGDSVSGAGRSDAVEARLKPVLEGSDLRIVKRKQMALENAEANGSEITTVFFVFAQFSVAAGILLIFLIFVMLAAERKKELGMARAVGTQRGHVIRMFTFEGAAYSLMAAAIGSALGVLVGLGMVRIMGIAFADENFQFAFSFNWRSVIIAYTLGMGLTFGVVLLSSWRVSRLNIVRAVRDLPEPPQGRKTLVGTILAMLVPIAGAAFIYYGLESEGMGAFMLGVSLVIIGLALIARRFGLSDRIAFTVAGLGVLAWWLLPLDAVRELVPDLNQGIEMFFLSGLMVVIGAVWTVIYNSDIILNVTMALFGRLRTLSPVMKAAVSYPMQDRLRTGMTLAMFSLVVFTLTVMGFVIASNSAVYADPLKLSGGYAVRTVTNAANPVSDMRSELGGVDGLDLSGVGAIGSLSGATAPMKQDGTDKKMVDDWFVRGVDQGYAESVTFGFLLMDSEFSTPREVWQALMSRPNTAIVDDFMVRARTDFSVGESGPDLQLEGFYREDRTLPETYLLVRDPRTGTETRLRVLAVACPGLMVLRACDRVPGHAGVSDGRPCAGAPARVQARRRDGPGAVRPGYRSRPDRERRAGHICPARSQGGRRIFKNDGHVAPGVHGAGPHCRNCGAGGNRRPLRCGAPPANRRPARHRLSEGHGAAYVPAGGIVCRAHGRGHGRNPGSAAGVQHDQRAI
ncbi:MAG: ABC transporter permease [SAR202 cluster bacterium]|nr:ABC transporter permease [SAR202 cluster bacterium]